MALFGPGSGLVKDLPTLAVLMAHLGHYIAKFDGVPSAVVARKKMKPLWSHLVFYGNLVFLVTHSKTSENHFKHQMTILLIEENECLHINELLER